jgi:ABC-type uncharacterized transport system fused permease/ATPase subunit
MFDNLMKKLAKKVVTNVEEVVKEDISNAVTDYTPLIFGAVSAVLILGVFLKQPTRATTTIINHYHYYR